MRKGLQRYLEKRSVLSPWVLEGTVLDAPRAAVVIPALGESARLFHTLDDLAAQSPAALAETQIICVVNNRPAGTARTEDITDNLRTLELLRCRPGEHSTALAWIDAASPGRELPQSGGVGLARKLGMDRAITCFHESGQESGVIICLDADTRVTPGYLNDIISFYRSPPRWAGILPYAHPLDGTGPEQAAIIQYELFLRYHELGLRLANSPYAFHTIGSTMTCTAEAYVAVSGMNQRQAGEDFYFLQQLAKTGKVERIVAAPAIPSARASHRVPFGTGQRVRRHLASGGERETAYHPEVYRLLRQWLQLINDHSASTGAELCGRMHEICPCFAEYLDQHSFAQVWDALRKQCPQDRQILAQFHRWFDGFRTLKCIHYLRDHGFPNLPIEAAITDLLALPAAGDLELLLKLRQMCQTDQGRY